MTNLFLSNEFIKFANIINRLKNLKDKIYTKPENKFKIKKLSNQDIQPIDMFNNLSFDIDRLKAIIDNPSDTNIPYLINKPGKVGQENEFLELMKNLKWYIKNVNKFKYFIENADKFTDFIELINETINYTEKYIKKHNKFIKQLLGKNYK